jgi:hypothetical protein
MAGPKARESAPRGQWPPAEKRRIAELPLRAGAKRTALTTNKRLSEEAGRPYGGSFGIASLPVSALVCVACRFHGSNS